MIRPNIYTAHIETPSLVKKFQLKKWGMWGCCSSLLLELCGLRQLVVAFTKIIILQKTQLLFALFLIYNFFRLGATSEDAHAQRPNRGLVAFGFSPFFVFLSFFLEFFSSTSLLFIFHLCCVASSEDVQRPNRRTMALTPGHSSCA